MMPHNRLISSLTKGLTIAAVLSAVLSGCFFRDQPADDTIAINDDEVVDVRSDLENEQTKVRITVPDGWNVVRDSRRRSTDIYATYPSEELYAAVLSEKISVLNQFKLEDNAEQYRWLIREELDRFEGESRTGLTSLNRKPAIQYEMRGIVNGLPVVYLHTTVAGRDNYYQVVGWTTASSYGNSDHKETLETIIKSFEGL